MLFSVAVLFRFLGGTFSLCPPSLDMPTLAKDDRSGTFFHFSNRLIKADYLQLTSAVATCEQISKGLRLGQSLLQATLLSFPHVTRCGYLLILLATICASGEQPGAGARL